MKKQGLIIFLSVILLFSPCVGSLASEASDFQGKWVARYLVQFGLSTPVEDIPIDVVLDIEGRIVFT